MEEVCERGNLKQALRRVQRNGGSPGIDGMTVEELPGYLAEHWPNLRAQLLSGTYQPQPVKRVPLPKPDGGVRNLGIPTALDRYLQQAVMQVLQRRWDRTCSEHSYGFRPNRSAHQAVARAQQYIAEGYRWVVDFDLDKFFRPGQPRQIDGTDGAAGGRPANAQTGAGVPERRSNGERPGEPDRGGGPARWSALALALESGA